MKLMTLLRAAGLVCLLMARSLAGTVVVTQQNVMAEVSFVSQVERADPFNEVVLDVVFKGEDGREMKVPAFWDGGKNWKVRFASPLVGTYSFKTDCSDGNDGGLAGVAGEVKVEKYVGENPLYIHGPIQIREGERYFRHADGTPFFWLGDTWWMGLTSRLHWPGDWKTLLADRKAKGFTVVQLIAGLYPDMGAFDERGRSDAGFPWEKEYARIRPEYFDLADQKMNYLVKQGVVPCIVGTWGYHLPWLGEKKMEQQERYVYARWGALPMVWCLSGEMNLPYYQDPNYAARWAPQAEEWKPVVRYCRSINCFGRAISAHPSGPWPCSIRNVLKDPDLVDFDMLQTPHGQMEVIGSTVGSVRYSYDLKPVQPVVNAEPSYEMLFDRTPSDVVRRVFWSCWVNGVKGYTYGANGIWQMNRKEKPYGKSASGGDYGKIAWDDAMKLGGSEQAGLGKKLMMGYAWEKFEPHMEWAGWQGGEAGLPLGDWIWFAEGEPAKSAPVGVRYLRHEFELPAAKVKKAWMQVAADDECKVWVNGAEVGSSDTWRTLKKWNVGGKLKAGKNVILLRAENMNPAVAENPAGVILGMRVEMQDGSKMEVKSDAQWEASLKEDGDWSKAVVAAKYGEAPWGKIEDSGGEMDGPMAMGIGRQVRMVYVPGARGIVVRELEEDIKYHAFYFDPVTGVQKDGPAEKLAAEGWEVEEPGFGHDWVLVLEAQK